MMQNTEEPTKLTVTNANDNHGTAQRSLCGPTIGRTMALVRELPDENLLTIVKDSWPNLTIADRAQIVAWNETAQVA